MSIAFSHPVVGAKVRTATEYIASGVKNHHGRFCAAPRIVERIMEEQGSTQTGEKQKQSDRDRDSDMDRDGEGARAKEGQSGSDR